MINIGKGDGALTAKIAVRLHPDEKFALQQDAKMANLSVSELVRRQYFRREIVPKIDALMLAELRRIGGLLKHIHNQSGGAYSQQTSQALGAVTSLLRSIDTKNDS